MSSSISSTNSGYTHDHRGRPLSSKMSALLSSTVIPKPKEFRKRQKPVSIADTDECASQSSEEDDRRVDDDILSSLKGDEIRRSRGFKSQRIRNNRIDIPDIEDVSGSDHPLSDYMEDISSSDDDEDYEAEAEEDEQDEDDESASSSSPSDFDTPSEAASAKPLNSIVTNLTASLKAVAQTFANDAFHFNFSPRITDEPIPSRFMDSFTAANKFSTTSPTPVAATAPSKEETPPPQENSEPAPAAKPARKKPLPLKTYSIHSTMIPHLRPREVRMNPEFYRIFAVENRMKKNGKLNQDFVGKAQMFLEPRTDYNQSYLLSEEEGEVFGIRKRFVSSYDNLKSQKVQNSATIHSSSPRLVSISSSDEEGDY